MLKRIFLAFAALVVTLTLSSSAFAQKTTVIRVVQVKTDDPAAYARALEQGQEVMKKVLGTAPTVHVYRASFAGPNAGSVAAVIEYPNLVAMAEADAKLRADKDYQAWIKSLDKIRTIVSDSIYNEL